MRRLAYGALVIVLLLVVTGCSGASTDDQTTSTDTTGTPKGHGVAVTVNVTPEMLGTKPSPPTLRTPESAVRSYLDWISYAYRIGDSDVAIPTMSALEEVHVNSYVQFNLQEHNRLIDQRLESIEFGDAVTKDASTTVLPAREHWTYTWVSAQEAGEVVGGPFSISYDTTYTVVKNAEGTWVVDSVEAEELGTGK